MLEKDKTTHEGFLTWLADMMVSNGTITAESMVYTNLQNCAEELVNRAERIKILCTGSLKDKETPLVGGMFRPSGSTIETDKGIGK